MILPSMSCIGVTDESSTSMMREDFSSRMPRSAVMPWMRMVMYRKKTKAKVVI